MPITNCISCDASIQEDSTFCYNCGTRLKCKSCTADLQKGANFCSECGESTIAKPTNNGHSKNTVVYHRKADEIHCEASLSDDVAKTGLSSLFDSLASNKQIQYQQIHDTKDPEIEDVEAIDDEKEVTKTDSKLQEEEKKMESPPNSVLLPHLNDVEMTVTCSEGEWMVIYAFYLSDFAKRTFTRDAVYERYMAKRKTDKRVKNFSPYWKALFKHYFSTVNEKEIKFKSEKLGDLKQLILGQKKGSGRDSLVKTKSTTINPAKQSGNAASKGKSNRSNSTSESYSIVSGLNLNPSGRESFEKFFSTYTTNKNPEIILIIVYYLEKILKETAIDENKIYTCLKSIKRPVPKLRKALSNIKTRFGWLNTASYNDIRVAIAGENYIEHKMAKTNK